MVAGELQRQKAVFAASDGAALLGAFVIALALHDPAGAMEARLLQTDLPLVCLVVVVAVLLWVMVFRACDLYRMRNGGLWEAVAVVRACTIAALLTVAAGFFAHIEVSRLTAGIAYLLSVPMILLCRTVTRSAIRRFYANPKNAIPLVLVGLNAFSRYLCDQVLDEMTPYELAGFVDDSPQVRQYRGCPVFGPAEQLTEMSKIYPSLEAAIVLPDAPRERQEQIIRLCEQHRVRWWLMPWVSNLPNGGLRVEMFGLVPLISPRGSNIEGLNFAIKRAFDLAAGLILLTLASPVLAASAFAVWFFDGSPVLFRQTRIGIHGKPFNMLKLRTMRPAVSDTPHREYVQSWIQNGRGAALRTTNGDGEPVFKLSADNRVTAVGRILRRFSIDELPQLINVIRGEMSLIGPRPALPYELELYKPWHLRRLDAIPGITGLWQVSGRNRLSFDEMVRLDVQYLQDWSLVGDLRILARTLPTLLRGEGV